MRPSLPGDFLFVSEFIDFMISSKDISLSQRLKCSLDILFLLRILVANSVVAAIVAPPLAWGWGGGGGGVNLLPNVQNGGIDRSSVLRGRLLGKRG